MKEALSCLAPSLGQMVPWQAQHRLVEERGVLFAVGAKRFPTGYANTALPLLPDIGGAEVLERVDGFYRRLRRPYILWVAQGMHDELEQAARSAGMTMVSEMPAMLVHERLPERGDPAGLELAEVADEKALADFVEVSGISYEETGLPPHVMHSYFARPEKILSAGHRLVLARCQGQPVAAALSVTAGEGAARRGGVCWVGTKPGRRGLGAGEACTRAATNAAFDEGASVVALEASEMGEPIYRRMGYVEVGRYRWYLGGVIEESDL